MTLSLPLIFDVIANNATAITLADSILTAIAISFATFIAIVISINKAIFKSVATSPQLFFD